ncbi:hypothetical protein GYMLUDRAFT_49338 [Collybiopsis luxurians FD-317 M1]|uniref:Hikeshi-like domain-containing protein n=1 Tax=Collybiopsis luxurians FD-317 M1 TaxID=944289 RepID=A0A0D0BF70_9AGAR|nr:hypothetical protein GYMLUDRAFT_49338 [Collybiopsis luxurians FD-317 M1]
MFGCLVAGRLLQTNLQQIDETHAIFELPNASTVNHVCVFLLGNIPFPDGYGATVHLHWPGRGFQLLGMLSNEKPSAIFRLRASFSSSTTTRAFQGSSSTPGADTSDADVTAVLGISIEPLSQIFPQLASISNAQTNNNGNQSSLLKPLPDATLFAERIVRHLFNYLSGFATTTLGPDVAVPMGVIEKWYETFSNKVKHSGTAFLEKDAE